MRKRTHEIPRNDRDILGDNTNNNAFDSSAVVANADGSLIERMEYLQTAVGGAAGQLRFQQSESTTVEDNAFQQFSISLIDINSGAITSANINIASIAVEMAKSTGGGAFSAVGITQPTFAKADGRVYTSYQFLDAEWAVGDVYRLTVSDIVVTFGAEFAYVPMMVWSNMVTDIIDIDTVVDSIKVDTGRIQDTALTIGMGSGSLASYIAGNNGGLGSTLPASTSLYDVVKYLANVADGGTVSPTKVLDNSILSIILSKVSGGDISSFDNSTDSLEAISDKVTDVNADLGNFSGQTNLQSLLAVLGVPDVAAKDLYTCLITDRLDNATFGLDAISTDTSKIQDVAVTIGMASGSLASYIAGNNGGLGTALPVSTSLYDTTKNIRNVPIDGTTLPVANTLSDILHKDGSYTYDNTTDSLEAISDKISLIPTTTVDGATQIAVTTVDLNQAASSYDLFTGTTQRVLLESLIIKMPTGAAGGALTSISVQTDDVTAGVIISSADGALANLTSEAELSWTGAMLINVGTKIQLTIDGGAHGSEYITTIIAKYVSVIAGGTLA